MALPMNIDEVEVRAKALNPNLSLDRSTYTKASAPCRWVDSEFGEFWRTPYKVLNGRAFHKDFTNNQKRINKTIPSYEIEKRAKILNPKLGLIHDTYKDTDTVCVWVEEGFGEFFRKPADVIYKKHCHHPDTTQQRRAATNTEKYGSPFLMQNKELSQKAKDSMISKYGAAHPSQVPELKDKIEQTSLSRYGSTSILGSKKARDALYKKTGASKSEIMIREALTNRGIDFKEQELISGKIWDFAVFKNSKLHAVIEADSEFHHSLNVDPFTKHNLLVPDNVRFSILPEGTILINVDSLRIKQGIPEIFRLLDFNYDEFIEEIFEECKDRPFPFPEYSDVRMLRDWKNLKSHAIQQNTHKLITRLMPANSIITNFHKSIYTSKVGNKPSPVEAWSNEELLRQCIDNRFIYKSKLSSQNIARGFEKNRIAPRVTAFQPYLARYLLQTYAPNAKSVIDPFSGFSGRMLGAASLGMSYYGSDIRKDVVAEGMEIVKFLNLDNAHLSVSDAEIANLPEADVLLTCPPYGNKEVWLEGQDCKPTDYYIDLCLARFQAGTYIFVVDGTEKHKENIALSLSRSNHMNDKSTEQVLVFHKIKK